MKKRLSRIDREAMKRAIEQLRRKGGEDARQIEGKLREEPWDDVGRFAAYSCQDDALHPEPWQPVPANEYVSVTDDDSRYGPVMGRAAAAELLRRLLAAGLSRFEPDPLGALARVEAERTLRPSSEVSKADKGH
jgi:hypothetical protein